MSSRSLTLIVAAGVLAAGCDSAAGNKSVARTSSTAAVSRSVTSVDALVADADVAVASGDMLSARQFLAQALDSEPGNAKVRARLIALGGVPRSPAPAGPPLLAAAPVTPAPAPIVAPAPAPTRVSARVIAPAPTMVAAAPVTPATVTRRAPAAQTVAVAPRPAARAPQTLSQPLPQPLPRTMASRGEVEHAPVQQSVATESHKTPKALPSGREALADARVSTTSDAERAAVGFVVRPVALDSARGTTVASAPATSKHKRTWPWTRAQRWLVAKGIVGGTGAGVLLGAIIGNVPGALIAGSLTGGAVGFKKATEIGPAAPYPSANDSVAFDRTHGHQAADSATRVATSKESNKGEAVATKP